MSSFYLENIRVNKFINTWEIGRKNQLKVIVIYKKRDILDIILKINIITLIQNNMFFKDTFGLKIVLFSRKKR